MTGRLWVATVVLATGWGCTLINQLDAPQQCSSTNDCIARGSGFENSVCGAEGVCVKAPTILQGPGGAAGAAGSAGQSGAAGSAGGPACKVSSDCTGGRFMCREGACIPLTTKYCTTPLGDETEPDEYVGLMVPLYGSTNAAYGNGYRAAVAAGLQEYGNAAKQVGKKAPVFVVCDELESPADAIDHLLNTIKVKTIIGPSWQKGIDAVVDKIVAAGAIALLPINDDPNTEKLAAKSPGQVWTCRPNRSDVPSYWAAVLTEATKVIAERSPDLGKPQVTMVVAGDSSSQTLANQLVAKQTFEQGQFTRLNYDDYRSSSTLSYSSVATGVLTPATKPNLVIIVSSGDGADGVIPVLENTWTSGNNLAPRPYYLLLGGTGGIGTALSKQVAGSKLASRILTLDAARSAAVNSANSAFQLAYNAINPGQAVRPDSEYFYDCFWVNQYAMYAGTDQNKNPLSALTGADYASKGVSRLIDPNGLPVNVGALGADAALPQLQNQSNIKLTGAGSSLDYDLTKGTPKARGSLGCVTEEHPASVVSGLEFDPQTGAVATGTTNTNCH